MSKLSYPYSEGIGRANSALEILRRTFTLSKETFLKLYKALVRPHLEYENIMLFPYLKRQSSKLRDIRDQVTDIWSLRSRV